METESQSSAETRALVKVEKLDARWVEKMAEASDFDIIGLVRIGKESEADQKKKFLVGEIENPVFEYPYADVFNPQPLEEKLLTLKKEIKSSEPNRVVRTFYLWKINEQLAKLRLVQAIKEGKGKSSQEQRRYDRRVYQFSRFIWGEPPPEIGEIALQEAQERITPKKEKTPDEEKLTSEEMVEIFEAVVKVYEAQAEVRVDPRVFRITIEAKGLEEPEVLIPEGGKKRTIQRVKEMASHEIEAHVLQREGGRRMSPRLGILQIGLDRFATTGEGLGVFAERKMGKKVTTPHPWVLTAMTLARDNNFRQTFETLKGWYIGYRMRKGLSREEATEKANEKCWRFCRTIYRGIRNTSAPGSFLTRDWAYRKGSLEVMTFINNWGEDQLKRLYLGRVGLKHLGMLFELGITDSLIEPRFIAGQIVDLETAKRKDLTKEE